jgi:quercetin dioxygenase-like cupin family protein
MNLRDKARKDGAVYNLFKGDSSWIEPAGIEVHLVLTPRVGPKNMGMTVGVHQPGQGMGPHVHPLSEEILIVYRGKGEIYLKDKWIPVKEGDVVYAPPGIYHGTRNPEGNTEIFTTIGCGAPPQLDLYQRSNYDPLADDK